VVDPSLAAIVADAPLAGGPDYVRYVATTREVWVTEPSSKQIEVFSLPTQGKPQPTSVGTIRFDDGPESLVIDGTRKRAYTHEWGSKSHAVDLTSRKIVATWANGCAGSRGIALDEKRGFLFVGCEEGKAVVLDVDHDGRVLASLSPGVAGVDIIAYSPSLGHLYLPGESSGTIAFLAVAPSGGLSTLGIAAAASGSHCVAADDRGGVWVCDPDHGRLLYYRDAPAADP
jgi:sugar lactone lactonase YvrE